MKKFIFPLVLLFYVCNLVSCSKDLGDSPNLLPGSFIPAGKSIVSNWFSVELAPWSQDLELCLVGQAESNQVAEGFFNYNKDHYIELAFVRVPSTQPAAGIHSLPWVRQYPDELSSGTLNMNFGIDPVEFTVSVKAVGNANGHPASAQFSGYLYRFLVIPKSFYQAHKIDWTNYGEVSQVLNLP